MKRISLSCCLAALWIVAPAHADDHLDAMLKMHFPDRDLTKCALKIVDHQRGFYVVGDTLEILKNGQVRITNAAGIKKLTGPNQPGRYSSYAGPRMTLSFEKPIKQIADLKGNKVAEILIPQPNIPNNQID